MSKTINSSIIIKDLINEILLNKDQSYTIVKILIT